MEKELLQQALNSILHGSTQIISSTDNYGNLTHQEVRVNDLRVDLVEKIAQKLVQTEEFKKALLNAFTADVIKELQKEMLSKVNYNDLPYDTKRNLEAQMKNIPLEIKKYKLVAEVVDETPTH